MGYMKHDLLIMDFPSYSSEKREAVAQRLREFKAKMPKEWADLIVGPNSSVTNGYEWVLFLPDGSKEGWDESDKGEDWRAKFLDAFSDVTTYHAEFGSDFEADWGSPRFRRLPRS